MAAAVPIAIKAAPWIASAVGSWIGKKKAKPNEPQQAAMTQGQAASTGLANAAAPLLQTGAQTAQAGGQDVNAAAGYYRNILGNRGQARTAMAPETTTALNYYAGAANKTRRSLQGADRDYALAELDRQKVGQVAGFLPNARRGAAESLGQLGLGRIAGGSGLVGQGTNALANSGYLSGQQFNQGTQIYNQEKDAGKAWGGMIYDLAKTGLSGWGRGGGSSPGHGGIYDVND